MNPYRYLPSAAVLLLTCLTLLGCGQQKSESSQQDGGARQIIVGTFASVPRVSFIDIDGKLTGYDIEVAREVERRLPQYEFKFESMEFPLLFLSLDTRKIDLIAMHLEKNAAREEKYLFNKIPYDHSQTVVAVSQSRNDIHSLEDLKGKRVIVGTGTNTAFLIEEFNKRSNGAVQISYGVSFDDVVQQIRSERVDASLMDASLVDILNTKIDAKLKAVGPSLKGSSGIHFAFRKEDEKFAADVDSALAKMKDDGTLNRLSRRWLDRDYE